MNKALTNLNDGQKKPPHHVGEDRDGVYGKENRDTMLLVTAGTARVMQRWNLLQIR